MAETLLIPEPTLDDVVLQSGSSPESGADISAEETDRSRTLRDAMQRALGLRDRVQAVVTAYESGLVHAGGE